MSLVPEDLDVFRLLLARRLGLRFGVEKNDFMLDALKHGMEAGGHESPAGYFAALETSHVPWDSLIQDLTVGETYFFRQWDHFLALTGKVIPERLRARAEDKRLHVLSAGCSSGEEAYSLAMSIHSHFPELASWKVEVKGVDINPASLAKAAKGIYSKWSLRDLPEQLRQRFLIPQEHAFLVEEGVRRKVVFERRNLSEPNHDLWPYEHYDLIFCRNMLMYYTQQGAAELVARMAHALVPGGYLFLGSAETLRGLSTEFEHCYTHNTSYYQLRPGLGSALGHAVGASASLDPANGSTWDPLDTWVRSIARASDRIATLSARTPSQGGDPGPSDNGTDPLEHPGLERALDLTRQERFREALSALPTPAQGGMGSMLLRAVLLLDLGRSIEALAACTELLALDPVNSNAHYVMALCLEHGGDPVSAVRSDQCAASLDAGFAMPWLHQGILARSQGDLFLARTNFERALALLPGEERTRLRLFSGGFGREGLAQLCRSSLMAMEKAR